MRLSWAWRKISGQTHGGHGAALQYVGENPARPHAGQLVGVADEDEPRVLRHSLQESVH